MTGSTLAILKSGKHLTLAPQDYETWDQFAEVVRTLYGPVRFGVSRFWFAWTDSGQEYTPGDMREVFKME
jgi:hypothetical protein